MKCEHCLNGPGARKVDLLPRRDDRGHVVPGAFYCPESALHGTVQFNDSGFVPRITEGRSLLPPLPEYHCMPLTRTCTYAPCGQSFTAATQSKYCSPECRQLGFAEKFAIGRAAGRAQRELVSA